MVLDHGVRPMIRSRMDSAATNTQGDESARPSNDRVFM